MSDYPEIITNPMDLSTLKKNLKKGHYKKISEFIEDLFLIWENCKTYNLEESDIYNNAVSLEEISVKLIKVLLYTNKEVRCLKRKSKSTDLEFKSFQSKNMDDEEMKYLLFIFSESTMDVDKFDTFTQDDLNRRIHSLSKEGLATVNFICYSAHQICSNLLPQGSSGLRR